jgi:hypothetical protein
MDGAISEAADLYDPLGEASRRQAAWLREAGDGARTRDPQLGKLMLYQLSYTRVRLSLAAVGAGSTRPTNGHQRTTIVERMIVATTPLRMAA